MLGAALRLGGPTETGFVYTTRWDLLVQSSFVCREELAVENLVAARPWEILRISHFHNLETPMT